MLYGYLKTACAVSGPIGIGPGHWQKPLRVDWKTVRPCCPTFIDPAVSAYGEQMLSDMPAEARHNTRHLTLLKKC